MKTQEEKKAESRLKVAKTRKGKKQMIKTGQPGAEQSLRTVSL